MLFKDSSIEGRGVFAKRRFSPGELVVPYAPKQRRLDASAPEAIAAAASKLTLLSGGTTVIVPDTSVPGGWLCNHSCEPNCETELDEDRIWITAVRDIREGEELSFNYCYDLEDFQDHPCRCGSEKCVGYIVAEEHFPHVRRHRERESSGQTSNAPSA